MLKTVIQCKKCGYKDPEKSAMLIRITEDHVFMKITESLTLTLNGATCESIDGIYIISIPECIHCT